MESLIKSFEADALLSEIGWGGQLTLDPSDLLVFFRKYQSDSSFFSLVVLRILSNYSVFIGKIKLMISESDVVEVFFMIAWYQWQFFQSD